MSKKLTRRGGGVFNRLDKNYPHSIHKLGYKFFACLATLVFILSTGLLIFPQKQTQQESSNALATKDDFNYIDEIWLGNAFNELTLQQLIEYVFSCKIEGGIEGIFDYGAESITLGSEIYEGANLEQVLEVFYNYYYYLFDSPPSEWYYTPFSSKEIRTFSQSITDEYGGTGLDKDPTKDIMVRFGGLDWTVACVSKNRDEEYVLTLWLSGNEQDAWQQESVYSQQGEYFGFVKAAETSKYGLYSDWSVDPNFEEGDCWPNYYATSYIRAVTLNNGYEYVVNGNDDIMSGRFEPDPNSVFAEFTMSDSPLCEFIETPSNIAWQLDRYDDYGGMDNNYVNDYINEEIIVGEPINDRWYMDKLWLPSLAEVGDNTQTGIWNTSSAQRVNTDGSFLMPYTIGFGVAGSTNLNGNPRQPYTGCWLRTSDNSFNGDVYFNWEPSQFGSTTTHAKSNFSAAVRPALHLNLSKAVQNTVVPPSPGLDHNTSTSSSNPDIYQVTTENGIDFHIKSAEGFLKLSAATEKGWSFDPSWTFYLDNDITVNAAKPIGGTANPFLGTFNGLGTDGYVHTINYSYSAGAFDLNTQCIFGTVGDCTIKNLVVNNNIRASASVCGLIADSLAGTTCNISHVTMQGSLTSVETSAYGVGQFHGDVNLYDVSLLYTTFNAGANAYIFGDFASNCTADTCRAITNLPSGASTLATLFKGPNLNINNVYANLTLPSSVKLEALLNVQNLTVTESQFDIRFSSKPSTTPKIISESATAGSISLYDALFNCTGLTNLFTSSNYPSKSTYYYTGVYFYDTQSKKTTILDPNFTPSKWCADPHLNDGMPQLRRFVSIGDFMEQCDMNLWSKQKMATQ